MIFSILNFLIRCEHPTLLRLTETLRETHSHSVSHLMFHLAGIKCVAVNLLPLQYHLLSLEMEITLKRVRVRGLLKRIGVLEPVIEEVFQKVL